MILGLKMMIQYCNNIQLKYYQVADAIVFITGLVIVEPLQLEWVEIQDLQD